MNSSSRKITQVIRLVAFMALLFAASGLLFAQAETTPAQTEAPAAQTAPQPATPADATAAQPAAAVTATPVALPAQNFFLDAPAADQEVIAKAEGLASQGKWLSAWKALSDYDATNANSFILAEKIRLALDGYAQTTYHLAFGFVDLAEGQDLESARAGAVEATDVVEFSPGDLAKAIEDKGEAIPPVLSMKLGDFYYTVWKDYQGQWLKDDAEILSMAVEGYDRALAYETFTAQSLDRQSEMLISLQRFDAAETVVKKGLELDPANNALTLRLADVYISMGKYTEVYPLADKVIAAAANDSEINDAYIVAIKSGLTSSDKDTLEKYLAGFEKSFPTEYMPGLVRHLVAVQLGDPAAADAAADAVTDAFPGNPDIIRSILSTWLSANDPDSGVRYLARAIAKAPGDEAMAALYFYKALLGPEITQTDEVLNQALADLATAEGYFKKSYPEGHEVFGMIDQLRGQWTDALKASQAAQSAAPDQGSTPAEATVTAPAATTEPAATPATTPATTTTTVDPAATTPAPPAQSDVPAADAGTGATE
ncbi:MAG: tetratricopeptide repeat protein [Spirochaetales bacterium]|jgi:hypothetical protein